jgi:hypothetical protein
VNGPASGTLAAGATRLAVPPAGLADCADWAGCAHAPGPASTAASSQPASAQPRPCECAAGRRVLVCECATNRAAYRQRL